MSFITNTTAKPWPGQVESAFSCCHDAPTALPSLSATLCMNTRLKALSANMLMCGFKDLALKPSNWVSQWLDGMYTTIMNQHQCTKGLKAMLQQCLK